MISAAEPDGSAALLSVTATSVSHRAGLGCCARSAAVFGVTHYGVIEQKAEIVGRMSVVNYCAQAEFGARFSYENKKQVPTPECVLLAVRDRRNCGPVLRIGLCWINQKSSHHIG